MAKQSSIRIVKRDERARRSAVADTSFAATQPRESARTLAAVVNSWADESRRKRQRESRRTLRSLFDGSLT